MHFRANWQLLLIRLLMLFNCDKNEMWALIKPYIVQSYLLYLEMCIDCIVNSSSEIPQYRLPYDAVNFEVELMKDLGVKVYAMHCFNLQFNNFIYKS